MYPNLPVVA
jgi:hypothetical protein